VFNHFDDAFSNDRGETMKRDLVVKLNLSFEEAACLEDGIEYWMARDLQVYWTMRSGETSFW
jgi:hypothetical protein